MLAAVVAAVEFGAAAVAMQQINFVVVVVAAVVAVAAVGLTLVALAIVAFAVVAKAVAL